MTGFRFVTLVGLMTLGGLAAGQQNVVILLDDSGSMSEAMRSDRRTRKMDAAKSALKIVLEQLPDDANVGLAILNGRRNPWVIPFGPIDKTKIADSLKRISARGSTPLGRHMKVGADALLAARAKQHYGTYKLLILTDGEAGDADLVERYLPEINARGIVVDVIGVDMRQRHSLATKTSSYRSADDPDSLTKAISAVLAETSTDDGDAGDGDFELLGALSDELAQEAIRSLASPSDDPIGGIAKSKSQPAAGPQRAQQNSAPPQYSKPANQAPRDGGGIGGLACILPLLFVGFIIARAVLGGSRR